MLQNTEKTDKLQTGRIYLKIIYLIKDFYPELCKELLQLNEIIIIIQLKKDLNRHITKKDM